MRQTVSRDSADEAARGEKAPALASTLLSSPGRRDVCGLSGLVSMFNVRKSIHPFEYNATLPRVFSSENNKLPTGNRRAEVSTRAERELVSGVQGLTHISLAEGKAGNQSNEKPKRTAWLFFPVPPVERPPEAMLVENLFTPFLPSGHRAGLTHPAPSPPTHLFPRELPPRELDGWEEACALSRLSHTQRPLVS